MIPTSRRAISNRARNSAGRARRRPCAISSPAGTRLSSAIGFAASARRTSSPATREGTLCFIEVKTRQSVEAGLPEEAITRSKQSRYERIALCYMMVTDDWDDNDSVRFDAIAICVTAPHRAMLRHHKGCFNECF